MWTIVFSADFNIVEKSPQEFEEWTAEETLLLLEAAERFGENWDRVASHVATKTKEQCIAQFLRLPIEEQFLEDHLSRALSDKSVDSRTYTRHDSVLHGSLTVLSLLRHDRQWRCRHSVHVLSQPRHEHHHLPLASCAA